MSASTARRARCGPWPAIRPASTSGSRASRRAGSTAASGRSRSAPASCCPRRSSSTTTIQRRFQYRITAPIFRHHRGTIDVIDLGDGTCLVVYSTDADPRTMALIIGGGTAGALDELKRQMEPAAGGRRTDGPQDPVRHHRPAALRHARLQRRHRSPARPVVDAPRRRRATATSARTRSRVVCMPSRSTIITGQHPSTHGVWMNGVPLPDRRAVGGDGAARRRLPHGASSASRTSSRSSTRSRRFAENRFARDGHGRPRIAASSTSSPPPTARQGPLHYARWLAEHHPEAVGMFYPVLDGALEVNALGGGETGAPQVHDNPIPRELVPHRLGGRPHDHLARLAGVRRRLVLLDELPRPAPPVGSARSPSWVASTGARSPCRPATSRTAARARGRARRQASALASVVRRHAGVELRGTGRRGCRPRSPPTRCARSTPATPSSAS